MGDDYLSVLNGRRIFHTTPLQYLPAIFACGELRSQRILGYEYGRPTARKRDKKLEVDRYIHCSLKPSSPLLTHKSILGYPHCVLEPRTDSTGFPPIAILPCSTKGWRSKWQCQPVDDMAEMARMLRSYDDNKRFTGLEILIMDALPLRTLDRIIVQSESERALVCDLIAGVDGYRDCRVDIVSAIFGSNCAKRELKEISEYYWKCISSKSIVTPPNLPFD
jgi:hypothetical protein